MSDAILHVDALRVACGPGASDAPARIAEAVGGSLLAQPSLHHRLQPGLREAVAAAIAQAVSRETFPGDEP
jgi:hypothetical protein